MSYFEEFKKDYYISNKDLLSQINPDLHYEMMYAAYEKIRDKARCSDYYAENKEQINKRHKEYYEKNKERLQEKRKIKYEENKKEMNDKRKEYIDCECGCLIQRGQLSRHKKTIKHSELLKTKNTQKAEDPNKFSMCCNVELTEIYKKCECRRCEDWGGCKHINGYYFSICPKCDKDFGIIKTVYWDPDIGHGIY